MKNQAFILVTGASTGIGRAVALLLAQKGYRVFAGVRRQQDAQQLSAQAQGDLTPLLLDVTRPEQLDAAFEHIKNSCGKQGLKAIINNAGINYAAPLEFSDETQARQLMEVNFFGPFQVIKKFLPLLHLHAAIYKNSARILNVGSVGSVSASPFISFYNASKFALLGLSESLRFELNPFDIAVVAVLPGGVKTEIWQKSDESVAQTLSSLPAAALPKYEKNIRQMLSVSHQFERNAITAEKAAQKFLDILENPKPKLSYFIGMDAQLLRLLTRLLPTSWRHGIIRRQLGF